MHLEIIFKDPNRKKTFLSKTKTLCAVILSYHLLTWFTGCPFRFFFGISCPGCGMTRALLAALRLDFAAAFSYHPLFFLLPFFLLGYYLDPWINWSRHYLLLGSVAALFVFTYLVLPAVPSRSGCNLAPGFRNPLKTILSSFKYKTSGIDFSVIFTEIHPGSF